MSRCSDNSCGDCSWCGYQEDEDEIFMPHRNDGPEPDDDWVDPDDEWMDYIN